MTDQMPERPERTGEWEMPPIPELPQGATADPSTKLSEHRTHLSRHRTRLSGHRTDLSEHRTDLSTHRTDLSTGRTEMSKRRTGMSFHRTRMSADRTLMSVIRTSLSLISFGFTIAQFFEKLKDSEVVTSAYEPRMFGMALVWLGIAMLAFGIVYHVQFMVGPAQDADRHERPSPYPCGQPIPGVPDLDRRNRTAGIGIAAIVFLSS